LIAQINSVTDYNFCEHLIPQCFNTHTHTSTRVVRLVTALESGLIAVQYVFAL